MLVVNLELKVTPPGNEQQKPLKIDVVERTIRLLVLARVFELVLRWDSLPDGNSCDQNDDIVWDRGFPCYFRICLGWWIFLLHPESQSTGQKNMASRHYLFGSLSGVGTLSITAVSIVSNPHFKPHSTHSKLGILRQHVFGPPKMTYTAGGCGLGPLGGFSFPRGGFFMLRSRSVFGRVSC